MSAFERSSLYYPTMNTIKKYQILAVIGCMLSLTGFSQSYWQQAVKYKMDIDLDVKTNQFKGKQELIYTNNSPDTLEKVFYHLYFNAFQPNSMMDYRSRNIQDPDGRVMDRIFNLSKDEIGYHKINSLTQDGTALTYQVEGTILEVDLAKPILPGGTSTFNMTFDSQVPKQIRRSGRDSREGIRYSMTQWYPKMAEYDKKGWHAHPYVGREFYAPFGDFEVNITLDKKYIIGGTGLLQNADEIGKGYLPEGTKPKKTKGKTLTWRFKAENVHDFAWAADPDYIHSTAQVPDGPLLHFFYQGDTLTENWEKLHDYTVKAFQYINENYGKYPYEQFTVIQGGDGGMEYPMATLITGHRAFRSLVGVTVHEALHSWYQGVIGIDESHYAWIDEGFTVYASGLTMAHLFDTNKDRAHDRSYSTYFALASSGVEEPMSIHADHFVTNFAYGAAAYSKGAVSLAQLGYIIGEEALGKSLKRYFYDWRFKHPDLNDFVRIAEKTSGLELDWYYEYFVNSTHQVDYGVSNVRNEDGNLAFTIEKKGVFPMPLDIQLTMKDGSVTNMYIPLALMRGEKPLSDDVKVLDDWGWVYEEYEVSIPGNMENVKSIEIDTSGKMADVDRENNTWEGN